MAVTGLSDLLSALARNKLDIVIGTAESAQLEFKAQPYLPWGDEAKRLEFAKDASAMANGGGGVIVIGYKTAPDALAARDVVTVLTPVSTNLVDVGSYQQVLESWTYPPMRAITMKWWGLDQGRGVLTIEIPAATEAQQPVLVIRASIQGVKRSILLGHFVRTEDRASSSTAAELHADIQLGRVLRRIAPGNSVALPGAPSGPTDEQRRERLEADTLNGQFGA